MTSALTLNFMKKYTSDETHLRARCDDMSLRGHVKIHLEIQQSGHYTMGYIPVGQICLLPIFVIEV